MFTGLISDVGTVKRIEKREQLHRLRIGCRYPADSIAIGASIACNGPCLTVVALETTPEGCAFEVEVGAETLARTTAAGWTQGLRLNLERSLKIGDELGGHLVTGHIDGVAMILEVEARHGMSRFTLRAPADMSRFIAAKGSVSLDGTSLTVNTVADDVFSVLLIPHTLAVTNWGDRRAGDGLNLEVDLMARYAARLGETRGLGSPTAQ